MTARYVLYAVALLAWWLGGFCYAAEPIAYVLCGGNTDDKFIGRNAVTEYDQWARVAGPIFKKHAIKEVWLQNPGGVYFDFHARGETDMRCSQWLVAEERGARFANRMELATAFGLLADDGVRKVYIYLGSPTQLADPVKELPKCVAPFVDAASGHVEVAFIFDALFYEIKAGKAAYKPADWAPGKPLPTAILNLRKKHEVYAEARLEPAMVKAGLGYLVDGTAATTDYDSHRTIDYTVQPGKALRITKTKNLAGPSAWAEEIKGWQAEIVPVLRSEFNWGPLLPEPVKGAQ